MGFVVTEEMFQALEDQVWRSWKVSGASWLTENVKALQEFVDRHSLAPASAVEEVELTDRQVYELFFALKYPGGGSNSETIRTWLAENGLRIVRDAKPAASFIRRAQPLNLPDDDGFCSVGGLAVDLGLYKSSDAKPVPADDAAKRDAKDATIAELVKRIGDLEIGYRDAKATNIEIMDLKQRLDSLERVARAEILGLGKRLAYFEHFSGISLSSANAKEATK